MLALGVECFELAKREFFLGQKEVPWQTPWKIVSDILRSILIHIDRHWSWWPGSGPPCGPQRLSTAVHEELGLPHCREGRVLLLRGELGQDPSGLFQKLSGTQRSQVVTLWGQEEWYQTAPHLAGDPKGFQGIPGAQMKPLGGQMSLDLESLELRYPGLTKESSFYDFQVGWLKNQMAASMIPLRRETFQESFKLIENLTEIDENWKWKQNQRPRFAENPIDHIEASLAIGFLFNTGWCHFFRCPSQQVGSYYIPLKWPC